MKDKKALTLEERQKLFSTFFGANESSVELVPITKELWSMLSERKVSSGAKEALITLYQVLQSEMAGTERWNDRDELSICLNQEEIAKQLGGTSTRNVRRYIVELERAGLIRRELRPGHVSILWIASPACFTSHQSAMPLEIGATAGLHVQGDCHH